ncbi:MAG: hypothetical protein ACI89Z_000247 [Porticoccus sp.]|jgi:hypothetical protein
MNNPKAACLLAICCGVLFVASLDLFAYGANAWISSGVGCAIGSCIAATEFSPAA